MYRSGQEGSSPGKRFLLAVMAAAMLVLPLFAIYLLIYDRQSQSEQARASIASGWGGRQAIAGPVLIIPYRALQTETVVENGKKIERTTPVWSELSIAPDTTAIDTQILPQHRKRSIYEVVVYEARMRGTARFLMPRDLARLNITPDQLALDRAELRFTLSDARGLFGARPIVTAQGERLALLVGRSTSGGGSGFHTLVDARNLPNAALDIGYQYALRGNQTLALLPRAGETRWTVTSPWPHPSFQGDFLPASHFENHRGFRSTWRIGNLALGTQLVSLGDTEPHADLRGDASLDRSASVIDSPQAAQARVDLVTPVDLYAQVNRSVKYGFLFIGFTFCAFLMFDVIGGVRVSSIEYLLVGAGLVLFFVMLLALAEVIGFALAYLAAAGAIVSLLTAYSAAVLNSWSRGLVIAMLLTALYGVLYVLLSLEAYSLLIGSGLLFFALAAVMFLTRNLDWSANEEEALA